MRKELTLRDETGKSSNILAHRDSYSKSINGPGLHKKREHLVSVDRENSKHDKWLAGEHLSHAALRAYNNKRPEEDRDYDRRN